MQVTKEILISPCVSNLAPCTIMFHLIFFAPTQVCQLFLYNFLILFHVDIAFGFDLEDTSVLPRFYGNLLTNT